MIRRVERIGDRRHRDRLGFRERWDRQERLLAEGALGPEKRDPPPGLRHCRHAGRIVMPMDELELRGLIDDLRSGACSPDDAVQEAEKAAVRRAWVLRRSTIIGRSAKTLPEAVYAPGKTPAQCAAIIAELLTGGGGSPILLTRANEAQVAASLRGLARMGCETPAVAEGGPPQHRRLASSGRHGPDASSSALRGPPTCPWPRSAWPCSARSASARRARRLRSGRRASPVRVHRRHHRCGCRRRRGRNGRGPGEPRGRPHAGTRDRRADERRLRRLARRA